MYKRQILNRAGISPRRKAETLVRKNGISKRIKKLVFEIHSVMIEAIDAGGSTLQDFRGVDGDDALGYFPNSFVVYGREGENCLKESCNGIIERIIQSNRSTFFCPKCQK